MSSGYANELVFKSWDQADLAVRRTRRGHVAVATYEPEEELSSHVRRRQMVSHIYTHQERQYTLLKGSFIVTFIILLYFKLRACCILLTFVLLDLLSLSH